MNSPPLELVYQIIDIVAKDSSISILNNCSLVSRAWCQYTRPHIFRCITISRSDTGCKNWVRRLKEAPHLIPLITQVLLVDNSKQGQSAWSVGPAQEVAQMLAHVHTLSIRDFDDSAGDFVDHHRAFISNLPKIQALNLYHIQLESAEQLFPFLSIMPASISYLSLRNVGCHLPYDYWEIQPICDAGSISDHLPSSGDPWRLRSLTLSSTELRKDVFSWLLSPAFHLSGLESLSLVAGFQDDARVHLDRNITALMDHFVATIGSSLCNLTLGVRGEGLCDNLHIAYFTSTSVLPQLASLETLTLVSEHRRGLNARRALTLANKLLPSLHASRLKEIALVIDFDVRSASDIQAFSALPWHILDKNIAAFTLQKVLVIVEINNSIATTNYNEEVVAIVEDAMPCAHCQHILNVDAREVRNMFIFTKAANSSVRDLQYPHERKALHHQWVEH
ncbi:hypothetical protein VNI00_010100 [Paramarasmius palmivorus]|uniref:F-box domain-containing protein n=1 Tax=Paramarasmius palmivorus TaxID=297713 RepID=A0AAW0CJQ1_9AGAR